ncbi:hypothetical protein ILUMI_12197, partial [Ignelater luminosus]
LRLRVSHTATIAMLLKSVVILGLISAVTVQARYDIQFTKTAKDCVTEVGSDEDSIRNLVSDKGILNEGDKTLEKFTECCLRTFITDTNEITINDTFKAYWTNLFAIHLRGRRRLATLVVDKCLEECKTTKGVTKGKAAVKMYNCMMGNLNKIIEKTD